MAFLLPEPIHNHEPLRRDQILRGSHGSERFQRGLEQQLARFVLDFELLDKLPPPAFRLWN
jgi:hypothetical protein